MYVTSVASRSRPIAKGVVALLLALSTAGSV